MHAPLVNRCPRRFREATSNSAANEVHFASPPTPRLRLTPSDYKTWKEKPRYSLHAIRISLLFERRSIPSLAIVLVVLVSPYFKVKKLQRKRSINLYASTSMTRFTPLRCFLDDRSFEIAKEKRRLTSTRVRRSSRYFPIFYFILISMSTDRNKRDSSVSSSFD